MKYLIITMFMLSAMGCTSSTPRGDCVGFGGDENPKLHYAYNGWNIAMGLVFVEMIIPPVVVLVDELKCPTGPKATTDGGTIKFLTPQSSKE